MGTRFIVSGVAKVVFAPAVATLAAPSRVEITAGTVLASPSLSTTVMGLESISGLELQEQPVVGADVNSVVDKKYKGRKSLPDAVLTFFDDSDGGGAIRTAVAPDTSGYLIVMKYGDVATERCEVWPGRFTTLNDSQVSSANELAKFMATFVVDNAPSQNAVIPAA